MTRYAAIELGGTSVRLAIAEDNPTNIVSQHELSTTTPDETLGACHEWLKENLPFVAIGIASFGPVDLNKKSPTYGHVTSTPKPHWSNAKVVGRFSDFDVPIAFDTDVNAPALAELQYGTHGDIKSLSYITVGTGVGIGAVVNGATVTGLMHMEGGHIMVPKAPGDDYVGRCPFHKTCVEGMVASHALAGRKDGDISKLPSYSDDDPLWDHAAWYLAQACLSVTLLLSPDCIVISGGIMKRNCLFAKIRKTFKEIMNGYIQVDKITNHLDEYIVPSTHANEIGIISACNLAVQSYAESQ
eukprot:CFRG1741T1